MNDFYHGLLAGLDRLERGVYHAIKGCDFDFAYDLYNGWLGGVRHLGWLKGDFERGERVTRMFLISTNPPDPCPELSPLQRYTILRDRGHYLDFLGHLDTAEVSLGQAAAVATRDSDWMRAAEAKMNIGLLQFLRGRLPAARSTVDQAMGEAEQVGGRILSDAYAYAGLVRHLLGDYEGAVKMFANARLQQNAADRDRAELYSFRGTWYCYVLLSSGKVDEAARLLAKARRGRVAGKDLYHRDILFATIWRSKRDARRSWRFLRKAYQFACRSRWTEGVCRCKLLEAMLYLFDDMHRKEAESSIREALKLADECGLRLLSSTFALFPVARRRGRGRIVGRPL